MNHQRTVSGLHIRGRLRASWADFLLGVVCVVLAGVMLSLTEDRGYYVPIDGSVGKPLELSHAHQTVEVVGMESSRSVSQFNDEKTTTSDVFLLVRVSAATPGERVESSVRCALKQGEFEVLPVSTALVSMPEPGFRSTVNLLFERPVSSLVGTELVCRPSDMILSHSRELVFDLGIDAAASEKLADQSRPTIAYDSTPVMEVIR